ncbi:metallophosphoesterase [Lederbergia galactosidilytica]|uniref:Phosphoesterase n=1 Tax=Lederbergia galactosidilytica TaxID=217031 RepID=A0A178A9D9_9BACI|nr:metallophosphoesterase [Lederbergia galactosidilytica]KRG16198.1 phosphoesterase [Virgibacillus soli]MBP1914069.1 putative MPP superfamily phosphohydrolase [Lederbergia galactosidilytica]OAK75628.1 phosphoesterase [Lederbergia galactosidilytica]
MVRKIVILFICLFVFWVFLEVNNAWIQTTRYTIKSKKIPKGFDGLKIVQISDLQDATFGKKQEKLMNKIKKAEPDLVVITGDLVDSNRYDLANSRDLIEKLVAYTDVFFVLGNHEAAINQVDEITETLSSLGVHVLRNQAIQLKRDHQVISILGVDDPLMAGEQQPEKAMGQMVQEALSSVPQGSYTILLSHRPELMAVYVENEVDLVFSGHAHGGQIRLPGLGGLIAPGQGWFPRYTSGEHQEGKTTMIISRGLGNSLFPYRIFNRPEIIAVTLKTI